MREKNAYPQVLATATLARVRSDSAAASRTATTRRASSGFTASSVPFRSTSAMFWCTISSLGAADHHLGGSRRVKVKTRAQSAGSSSPHRCCRRSWRVPGVAPRLHQAPSSPRMPTASLRQPAPRRGRAPRWQTASAEAMAAAGRLPLARLHSHHTLSTSASTRRSAWSIRWAPQSERSVPAASASAPAARRP